MVIGHALKVSVEADLFRPTQFKDDSGPPSQKFKN